MPNTNYTLINALIKRTIPGLLPSSVSNAGNIIIPTLPTPNDTDDETSSTPTPNDTDDESEDELPPASDDESDDELEIVPVSPIRFKPGGHWHGENNYYMFDVRDGDFLVYKLSWAYDEIYSIQYDIRNKVWLDRGTHHPTDVLDRGIDVLISAEDDGYPELGIFDNPYYEAPPTQTNTYEFYRTIMASQGRIQVNEIVSDPVIPVPTKDGFITIEYDTPDSYVRVFDGVTDNSSQTLDFQQSPDTSNEPVHIFSILSGVDIDSFTIYYGEQRFVPGMMIKKNGVVYYTETTIPTGITQTYTLTEPVPAVNYVVSPLDFIARIDFETEPYTDQNSGMTLLGTDISQVMTEDEDAPEGENTGDYNENGGANRYIQYTGFSYTQYGISLWVKFTSFKSVWNCIVGMSGYAPTGWRLYINHNSQAMIFYYDGGFKSFVIQDSDWLDTWKHIVITEHLYIDGVKELENIYGRNSGTNDLFIMSATVENQNNYDIEGFVDDVRVYDRTLTQEEATNLYNRVPPP